MSVQPSPAARPLATHPAPLRLLDASLRLFCASLHVLGKSLQFIQTLVDIARSRRRFGYGRGGNSGSGLRGTNDWRCRRLRRRCSIRVRSEVHTGGIHRTGFRQRPKRPAAPPPFECGAVRS